MSMLPIASRGRTELRINIHKQHIAHKSPKAWGLDRRPLERLCNCDLHCEELAADQCCDNEDIDDNTDCTKYRSEHNIHDRVLEESHKPLR